MITTHENFIVDAKGKKTAVILPFREYEDLLEDLADLAVLAERRQEKVVSHKEFTERLKKNGRL